MPYSADHKLQSRERIRRAAADLFCRQGYDSVSISQVMKHAKMTHGAFYAHFSSKGALYSEAIKSAAEQSLFTRESGDLTLAKIVNLIRQYLSLEHVNQEVPPCPLAFLSTDIAHRDKHVKASYEAVFNGMIKTLSKALLEQVLMVGEANNEKSNNKYTNDSAEKQGIVAARALAQQLMVNLVGTVSIARNITDPDAQKALLDNTKTGLINQLTGGLKA
ncbi:TetR/AcrR family transcriptional regulator [Marinomonas sp. S3726]|uniref:TetR/AcrR family transcriptional regulator n=1 Tax=Marinomonas sp. S3726 TaxID=579484 RepID=UPI0005F9F9F7|nr:TetR/AcrR family transcriptional regulator [Marinomonas sp. S3726]